MTGRKEFAKLIRFAYYLVLTKTDLETHFWKNRLKKRMIKFSVLAKT